MAEDTETSAALLLERRLRAYELALDAARRDSAAAAQTLTRLSARIAEVELHLSQAREHSEQLERELGEAERRRRIAEQRAYAERSRREELQGRIAELERGREEVAETEEQLTAAEIHRQDLEAEVARLLRRVDESDHLAEASRAARERAERRIAELTAQAGALRSAPGTAALAGSLRAEFSRAEHVTSTVSGPLPAPQPVASLGHSLALERQLISTHRRGPARAAGASSRSRAPASRLLGILRQLRPELQRLGELVERERIARVAAERRADELARRLDQHIAHSDEAHAAIEMLREQLAAAGGLAARASAATPASERRRRSAAASAPAPADPARAAGDERPQSPAGPVAPEHLSSALARLRATTEAVPEDAEAMAGERDAPALAPAPAAGGGAPRPWLWPTFERLARIDPEAAAGLLVRLLPMQQYAHPEPIAYDVGLEDFWVHVTVIEDGQRIELADAPRSADEVSFAIHGDARRISRLLCAGPLRRRLGIGLAGVRGERRALRALDELLRAPVSLAELCAAGVTFDPALTMKLVAAMIGPDGANREVFTIAHRAPAAEDDGPADVALSVDGARQPSVVRDVSDPTTTIVCAPDRLLMALGDLSPADYEHRGAREPLTWIQRRVKLAQSG